MITEKRGNIFTTQADTIVNTINCVGVMGAGIALEFRLRYPKMYTKYRELCDQKQIAIGKLWIYQAPDNRKILNFPTKYHWKYPSKTEYLTSGLQKFVDTYRDKGITSIAFPLLGADKGGIAPDLSLDIMKEYLSRCQELDVEIWHFDPAATDDKYEAFKKSVLENEDETLKVLTGIRINTIRKIRDALSDPSINSLSGLLRVQGIGDKTLEKLFRWSEAESREPKLF